MFAPGGPSPYTMGAHPSQAAMWRLRDGSPLPGTFGSYKSARETRRRVLALAALLLVGVPLLYYASAGRARGALGAAAAAGRGRRPSFQPGQNSFRVGIIADMDKASKCAEGWCSLLKHLTLARDPATGRYSATWKDDDQVVLRSALSEAGRGMELSELVLFEGRLLTFDDRTGIVFEVLEGQAEVVARHILVEGDGTAAKGMKIEWACVRDGTLWLGSHGREWTDRSDGSRVLGHAPEWAVSVDREWRVERHDWTARYAALRAATGHAFPGYLIHEAVGWSEARRRWVFLPRRASKEAYDDEADERRGANLLITADDAFADIRSARVGGPTVEHPTRGFASFKFVPGRPDEVAALRSEEDSAAGTAATYLTVFTLDGTVLMPDTLVASHKFEGLEFLS